MKKFLSVLLTLLLAVTACGAGASAESARDSVTILGTVTVSTLSPFTTSSTEAWVMGALYDRLVRFEPDGSIGAMLAESWELSEDGMTYTLHLRQGVKAHDGEEVNADDVIFSIDTLYAVENFYYLTTYMASWEKVDDYTVRIVKAAPYCETLALLASLNIVSKEGYEAAGAEGFGKAPVGTGPYSFESLGVDGTVTLKANESYWNGKPQIETLIVRAPLDMSTALVSLENGEIDVVTAVPAAQQPLVQANSALSFKTSAGWAAMTIGFMNGLSADVNLRKAIYHGINRDNAIIFATEGTAMPSTDVYSARTMGALAGTIEVPGYDIELAKDYLSKSGYAGEAIRFTVYSTEDALIAQSVQSDMAAIGVTIEIEQVDANTYFSMLSGGEIDLYATSMGMPMVALADMLLYWESDNYLWGPQLAHDAEYDEICTQIRTEADDTARAELLKRAMEIQYDLCNHLGLYETLFSVACSADLQGIEPIYVAAATYYPGDITTVA